VPSASIVSLNAAIVSLNDLCLKPFEVEPEFTPSIHIRVHQRGRRFVTTVEGLASDLDFKRLLRALKKTLHTNCSLQEGNVIQLQGDLRSGVLAFLLKFGLATADSVITH